MKKSISSRETAASEGANSRVLDDEEPQQVPAEFKTEEEKVPVPDKAEEQVVEGESFATQRNLKPANGLVNACAARRSKLSFPKHVEADEEHSQQSFLARRCDVVYKTILRDFRRFYQNEFNLVTGFSKKRRYRDKTYFLKMVQNYMHELD